MIKTWNDLKWVLIVTAIIGVLGVWYTYYIYDMGRQSERNRMTYLIEEERARQNDLVKQLEEARQQKQVVIREKIKTIKQVVDDCASAPIHPDILNQLR